MIQPSLEASEGLLAWPIRGWEQHARLAVMSGSYQSERAVSAPTSIRVSIDLRGEAAQANPLLLPDWLLGQATAHGVSIPPTLGQFARVLADLHLVTEQIGLAWVLGAGTRSAGDELSVFVLRVRYQSPLEIVLTAGAATPALLAILRTIRDWGAQRRVGQAQALIEEARADYIAGLLRHLSPGIKDTGIPDEIANFFVQPYVDAQTGIGGSPPDEIVDATGRLGETLITVDYVDDRDLDDS